MLRTLCLHSHNELHSNLLIPDLAIDLSHAHVEFYYMHLVWRSRDSRFQKTPVDERTSRLGHRCWLKLPTGKNQLFLMVNSSADRDLEKLRIAGHLRFACLIKAKLTHAGQPSFRKEGSRSRKIQLRFSFSISLFGRKCHRYV